MFYIFRIIFFSYLKHFSNDFCVSAYHCQFPASKNVQIASDIAGRWNILTTLNASPSSSCIFPCLVQCASLIPIMSNYIQGHDFMLVRQTSFRRGDILSTVNFTKKINAGSFLSLQLNTWSWRV